MSSSYSHLPSNLSYTNYTNNTNLTSRTNTSINNNYLTNSQNTNNITSDLKSPRNHTNVSYGHINNQLYTQNTKPNSSIKLNQMSSDLAKLKQQLSKIMNQADKLQKKNLNTSQSHHSNSSVINNPKIQQNQSQTNSKNYQIFNTQDIKNSVNSQKRQIAYQNLPYQLKNQQKVNSSISKSKDLSLNYLPQYQRKSTKLESYQSQKNLNFNSKNYFTDSPKYSFTPLTFGQTIQTKQQKKFQPYEEKIQEVQPKLKIKDQFKAQKPIESKRDKIQENNIIPTDEPVFSKKSSSSLSHELIVSQIMNEELSKKIESSFQVQQLRKKKQQEQLQYQQKIIELEHQKRKMKHQLNNTLLEKQNLQVQLKNQKSQKESLLKKYSQLDQILKINKSELEEYRTKCKLLQRKIQNQISRPKSTLNQTPSFDESLKQQLVQIKKYKDQLQQKDQEILRLKDLNTTHRRQIESLHNQIKIQQLKAASQVNQCDLKNSILIQDKQNEIKTFKNLITTLEAKLQVAVKQNKSKDAFMVQHLTGKAKTQDEKKYIEIFFKNYEIQFPVNKISEKIKQQQAEIERLKKTILQMAAIKK